MGEGDWFFGVGVWVFGRVNIYEIVNIIVYGMSQVQVRVPEKMIETLDKWVKEGKFKSRSDAIRTVLAQYEEKEKTRKFYKMLTERSREAEEEPEKLVPLE